LITAAGVFALRASAEPGQHQIAPAWRHGLTNARGNDRDFKRPGLKLFNPFEELP
jgi:hypothetical protein